MTTDRNLRAGLTAASARLKEVNSPELATYVDTALALGAFRIRESGTGDSLSIRLPESARDAIEDAADDMGVTSLSTVVDEGFRRFLAGEFTVGGRTYERRGTAEKKVNLNVRPAALLREQVLATGTSPMHVAADYLMRVFETGPYRVGDRAQALEPGSDRNPTVPLPVRERIRAASAGLASVHIEEGFQKFLDGEFTPAAPVWPAGAELVPLRVRPNNALFDQVAAATDLRPMQVGIAYLLHKYGIDPTATS
ncbi:hypothetical protein [Streptomyces microflavus]|uniref:hypothetical protein n=1 Tax=Streptomyces microflavus TaxID=1919 RepID=UPI00340FF047